jgi:hypothetical protein
MFCRADSYVPFMNSVVAINKMKQNGCPDCDTVDVAPDQDHVPCAQFSILYAKQFFDRYRFIDCSRTTAINELKDQAIISVYPNPSRGVFNIEAYNADETISAAIYDATGRKVQDIALHMGVNSVSTDNLASGVYAVKITDCKGLSRLNKITVGK